MKSDIILAGVGGQGILSIAATIGMVVLLFSHPELVSGSLKLK
jgi:Pyruvate/2-oxoacid:ferredoxin oxidoreductase gamma subunit